MKSSKNPKLLIVEDDKEQMELLVSFALSEIQNLADHGSTNDKQKQILQSVTVIKANNVQSLKKITSSYKDIFLAVLDCNLPDSEGQPATDQLIKTNYRITGQHRPVDIVLKHLPNTPITMISAFNRFQSLLNQYYESKYDLSINFIRKSDQSMIKRNIAYYLRQFIRATNWP